MKTTNASASNHQTKKTLGYAIEIILLCLLILLTSISLLERIGVIQFPALEKEIVITTPGAEEATTSARLEDESETEVAASAGIVYDDAAVEGGWDQADEDAIIASLNEKVEEGMINISMNTAPVFADGTSEGGLMIVNEAVNRYPQKVEITRNDTGETIYTSGAIPVGSKIESAALDVDLPAGSYECTALFHNLDPETGESLGCAGAIITVIVQG